jgi:hypothetical protein
VTWQAARGSIRARASPRAQPPAAGAISSISRLARPIRRDLA